MQTIEQITIRLRSGKTVLAVSEELGIDVREIELELAQAVLTYAQRALPVAEVQGYLGIDEEEWIEYSLDKQYEAGKTGVKIKLLDQLVKNALEGDTRAVLELIKKLSTSS